MVMNKTTIYLPDDLKRALKQKALETRRNEAEVIRDALRRATTPEQPPAPTIPIFISADPQFAEHAEDHLTGFGRQ